MSAHAPAPPSSLPTEPGRVAEVWAAVREKLRAGGRRLWLQPVVVVVALVALLVWFASRRPVLDGIERRNLNTHELTTQLVRHLELSVVSTVLVVVIAVPLGILVNRQGSGLATTLGLGLGNVGQAIPSVGLVVLLALVIGTGFWTAVVGLVVYSVLPVLRNTIVGLESVDPVVAEAARGMGLSRGQVLRRVELPLAVPVILAGIRTALVLTVASAVLATFIGGGGLGDGLVTGIGQNRPLLSVTFGILVAALAMLADWLGLVVEVLLRPLGVAQAHARHGEERSGRGHRRRRR